MAKNTLYQGTLDLLIFRSVLNGPMHGGGICRWLIEASGGHVHVPQGSLYPALHRLEGQGLLTTVWQQTPEGRKTKHYLLSQKGRKALSVAQARWEAYVAAVSQVIAASEKKAP